MIHYIGKLQRTPGRRACGAVSGQADSRSWHATDCSACQDTLVGLEVRRIGSERAVGTIKDLTAVGVVHPRVRWVGIHWTDEDGASGADTPSLYELENSWELNR